MGFLNVRYKLMLKLWIFFPAHALWTKGDKKIRA